jgi:hypothetical protein
MPESSTHRVQLLFPLSPLLTRSTLWKLINIIPTFALAQKTTQTNHHKMVAVSERGGEQLSKMTSIIWSIRFLWSVFVCVNFDVYRFLPSLTHFQWLSIWIRFSTMKTPATHAASFEFSTFLYIYDALLSGMKRERDNFTSRNISHAARVVTIFL